MSAFPLQTGSDFIFARLHGLWSKAAHGERLRKLTACVTEELLLQSLNNFGLEISRYEHFQKKLAAREISLLQNLIAWTNERTARFIRAKIRNIADENLKVLLNYRFLPEHEINVSELMIPIPGEAPYDCQSLLNVADTEKFLELLPDCEDFPELPEIIRKLEQDKDFTASDCAIDSLSFQQEMATAKRLSFGMRSVARDLVGREIDITNLSMLLRNVNMYHIDNERLRGFWIPFGKILPLKKLEVLGELQTIHEVIDALPPPFASMLHPYRDAELYHSEHALWNWLEKRTYQIFRDFSRPELSILAYTYLLHFETINLGRIYEGIRFGMPSSVIQEMMIGL